ncbi:hypothetical protein V1508DRAFT_423820 [Lipomyces doorenjongii]|uniref:uncharacterized protein n=1 Tax=Lipomyces doorenjongii TaxID=383834 RepID=UPI0034CF27AE
MSIKKTIVVIGATGVQGSSVARTFLSLDHWHVRAVTRNPSSAAAQTISFSVPHGHKLSVLIVKSPVPYKVVPATTLVIFDLQQYHSGR